MPACSICSTNVWVRSTCSKCKALVCSDCRNFALVSPSKLTDVSSVCGACFRSSVSLDLRQNVEVYGPEKGTALSVVLVHGGGGCRSMYRHLAVTLASQGFRCILPDLPGHGGRMDEPATVENCIAALVDVFQRETAPFQGAQPVYLGGSFGGYVGMEFIAAHPHLISGAILACCAQNTGIGASLKARMAMAVMEFMSRHVLSANLFVSGMMRVAAGHKHLDKDDLANGAQSGWYFHRNVELAQVLRHATLVPCMQRFHTAAPNAPVLHLNGEKDHRDTLEAMLALAPGQAASILYPDADHFFSHDLRVRDKFENDVSNFCHKVLASVKTA